jgi:tight adherence protein C
MDSSFLIAGLTFALVMLIAFLAFYYSNLYKKKMDVSERIRKEITPEQIEDIGGTWSGKKYLLRTISGFGEAIRPKLGANASQARMKLVRAGYYGENDAMVLYGSKAVMAGLLLSGFLLIKFISLPAMPAQKFLLLLVISASAGFYLPDYYLYRKTRVRKRKNFEGFPDALDLLVVCVEAGMGLDAAIKRVGDEMTLKNKVLSDEFRILSLELRAGKPRADALRNLAMRTDLEDVSSLVTLLIQTDRFGTRVAQALRVHSDSMRTKRYQRAEEVASKLPVKILFPLVLFILPGLVITLMGPAVIKFYRIILKGTLQW